MPIKKSSKHSRVQTKLWKKTQRRSEVEGKKSYANKTALQTPNGCGDRAVAAEESNVIKSSISTWKLFHNANFSKSPNQHQKNEQFVSNKNHIIFLLLLLLSMVRFCPVQPRIGSCSRFFFIRFRWSALVTLLRFAGRFFGCYFALRIFRNISVLPLFAQHRKRQWLETYKINDGIVYMLNHKLTSQQIKSINK